MVMRKKMQSGPERNRSFVPALLQRYSMRNRGVPERPGVEEPRHCGGAVLPPRVLARTYAI